MPGGLGPLDLDSLAQDLLDAAVASLDEIPSFDASLLGAPLRRFVSPGTPVWDCCEQIVVHAQGVSQQFTRPTSPPAAVGQRHRYGAWLWEVSLVLTVGRCVPEGTITKSKPAQYIPPSTEALDAAAAQINADGWALANGLANRFNQGLLSDKCSSVKWDGVNSATPMGGCGGWVVNFRLGLDGYGGGEPIGS